MNFSKITEKVFESHIGRTASFDMNKMLKQYLVTALWSSTDEEGEALDKEHDVKDIDESFVRQSKEDCQKFMREVKSELGDINLDDSNVGHDFWLTRNGHGAGFWDGDYEEEVGEFLTKISKKFKEVNIYAEDDGKIYSM